MAPKQSCCERCVLHAQMRPQPVGRSGDTFLIWKPVCHVCYRSFFFSRKKSLSSGKKKNSSREIKRASSERVAFGRAAGTSVAASAGQARAMPPMQRSRSAAAGSRSAADRAHRLNQRWRQAICDARRLQQPCRRSGDGGLIEGAPAGRSQTSPIYGAHLLQNVCEG